MEIRRLAVPAVGLVSVASLTIGVSGIHSTMEDPAHKQDIEDLRFFVSPEGDEDRCTAERSLDVGRKLVTLKEMTDEEAQGTADLMNSIGADGVTSEDVKSFRGADYSKIPGYDCGVEEGASTHVVMKTIEKRVPLVLGGLIGVIGALVYSAGHYNGRKMVEKASKS
jgi:hypothetical protein